MTALSIIGFIFLVLLALYLTFVGVALILGGVIFQSVSGYFILGVCAFLGLIWFVVFYMSPFEVIVRSGV